jgi:C-methyltransferase C-terminal domain
LQGRLKQVREQEDLTAWKADAEKLEARRIAKKGTMLLNYCQIGHETLDYIVDSTAIKQGRYMPGTRIPIRHPDTLKSNPPDYLLLLAWNYADEILRCEKHLREQGVKFILPIPVPQVISSTARHLWTAV